METSAADTPNKLDTARLIEQTPLQEEPMQNVLAKWFEIHDSIHPSYVSRQEWNERNKQGKGFLKNNQDNTKTIFLPTDLHLWEMFGVIEEIDKDTFINKPEIWQEKKREFQDLGKMFRNSAIYMAQRICHIQEGRSIAEKIVQEFFAYGNALSLGYMDEKSNEIPIGRISLNPITPEDTEKVDKWLGGKLYRSRITKAQTEITKRKPEKANQIIESLRRSTLTQFFRIAEKTLALNQKQSSSISVPAHTAFLNRIREKIQGRIEEPKKEFYTSIFHRGLEKLLNEMKITPSMRRSINRRKEGIIESLNLSENSNLADTLDLEGLKKDLHKIKMTGNIREISEKEIEITGIIQNAISKFSVRSLANNPTEMVVDMNTNCLGRVMLVGALMREIGINYMVANIPNHITIILITSDKRVFWKDTLPVRFVNENGELVKEDFLNSAFVLRPANQFDIATPQNILDMIVNLTNTPNQTGGFTISYGKNDNPSFRYIMPKVKQEKIKWINIARPEVGEMSLLLNNTAESLRRQGQIQEAIELLRQAIAISPAIPYYYSNLELHLYNATRYQEVIELYSRYSTLFHNNIDDNFYYDLLGMSFRCLGRFREAIAAYQKGIELNIDPDENYIGLGDTLSKMGKNEDALANFQKAISLNPKNKYHYYKIGMFLEKIKHNEDAIGAFNTFLSLGNETQDEAFMKTARKKIQELKRK